MVSLTTLNETTRSPIDGTEFIRFATAGANWKATLNNVLNNSTIPSITFPLVIGGTGTASTLTLESTSGVGTSDAIIFKTGSQVTRGLFDTNGNFIVGATSAQIALFSLNNIVEVHETTTSVSDGLGMFRWTADANATTMYLLKSRGSTVGSHVAVNNTAPDALGTWSFGGSDGTAFIRAAFIAVHCDGTVTTGHVPGSLGFFTTSTTSESEWLRIDSNGNKVCGINGALATNATNGFVYLETCAGTPTGVPTSYTGNAPFIYDTTSNRLWVYDAGWIATPVLGGVYTETVFTSSGTFTTAANSNAATVYRYRMVGGGGGSGGSTVSSTYCGAGGAGGEYAEGTFTGVAASTGITITIGAAGTAGANTGTNGGSGGNTTIGSPVSITANGGGGGGGAVTTTAAFKGLGGGGGSGSASWRSNGQDGQEATNTGGTTGVGPAGGSSLLGLGGDGPSVGFASAGITGVGYGAGASGTCNTAAAAAAGAVGTAGIVIIERIQG